MPQSRRTRSAPGPPCSLSDIKNRRARRPVEEIFGGRIAAGGVVADYVPFYFCNRSPMLGAISQGKVRSFAGGQEEVVYLVSSAQRIAKTDLVWFFTDGHAAEPMTDFFEDLADLDKVDWEAVETWKWGGRWRTADPDITRRKQAEFLTHRFFPWSEVIGVAVMNASAEARVRQVFEKTRPAVNLPLKIKPDWYYQP